MNRSSHSPHKNWIKFWFKSHELDKLWKFKLFCNFLQSSYEIYSKTCPFFNYKTRPMALIRELRLGLPYPCLLYILPRGFTFTISNGYPRLFQGPSGKFNPKKQYNSIKDLIEKITRLLTITYQTALLWLLLSKIWCRFLLSKLSYRHLSRLAEQFQSQQYNFYSWGCQCKFFTKTTFLKTGYRWNTWYYSS